MNQVALKEQNCPDIAVIEQVLMEGDLSRLTPTQRVVYYNKVCQSVGLNPLTRPLDYLKLNGKMVLYAKKDATEQLRRIYGVSIEGLEDKIVDDIYIVTAKAKNKDGRTDESKGAVNLAGLKGDAKANAIMKAETKAKRRVTLSISGMGFLDETEVDSIPGAQICKVDITTGEIKGEKIEALPVPQEKLTPRETIKICPTMAQHLYLILDECDPAYKEWFLSSMEKKHKTRNLCALSFELYDKMEKAAVTNMQEYQAKQKAAPPEPELIAVGA